MGTPEFLALASIALSALGSFVMYSWDLAVKRRKSARRVLFHYLEFWNYSVKHLQGIRSEDMSKAYLEEEQAYLAHKYPAVGAMDSQPMKELVEGMFRNYQNSFGSTMDDDFIENYKASLKELAEDFPVLAFSLNGREKLPDIFQKTYEYAEKINVLDEVKSSNAPTQAYVDWIGREAMKRHLSEFHNIVSHDLLLVAKKCGCLTYRKVRGMVQEPIPDLIEAARPELHRFIDKTMAPLMNQTENSGAGQ